MENLKWEPHIVGLQCETTWPVEKVEGASLFACALLSNKRMARPRNINGSIDKGWKGGSESRRRKLLPNRYEISDEFLSTIRPSCTKEGLPGFSMASCAFHQSILSIILPFLLGVRVVTHKSLRKTKKCVIFVGIRQ